VARHLRVRCDSDDEIVPIISGKTKTEFTAVSHFIDHHHQGRQAQHSCRIGVCDMTLRLAGCLLLPTTCVQEDLEKLRHPHLLGGATIGDELGECHCCPGAAVGAQSALPCPPSAAAADWHAGSCDPGRTLAHTPMLPLPAPTCLQH
jgi:hypothetical protein